MAQTQSARRELQSVAELVASVYQAADLRSLVAAVTSWLRSCIPVNSRDSAQLAACETRLLAVLESAIGLTPSTRGRGRAGRSEAAENRMDIDDVWAQMVDMLPLHGSPDYAGALAAAREVVVQGARTLATRRGLEALLHAARDVEQLGAPPSLVYRLNGELAWQNGSLQNLLERRKLDGDVLREQAWQLAMPICRRLVSDSAARTRQSRSVAGLNVMLAARPLRAAGKSEAVVCVEVAEAKRVSALSTRELEIAKLLAEAGSYQAVADVSGLSLDSVRTYVRRVYRKLGVGSRIAMRARLIRDGDLPK